MSGLESPPSHNRSQRVAALLAAWRATDRRWESTAPDSPDYRDAAIAVVRSWLAYDLETRNVEPGEVALVADDERRYVAVSPSVQQTIGYAPDELIGRLVDDLAPPAPSVETAERWSAFIAEGRQDGMFPMVARDGTVLTMRYQARAHYPLAGFHLSRLWPSTDQG